MPRPFPVNHRIGREEAPANSGDRGFIFRAPDAAVGKGRVSKTSVKVRCSEGQCNLAEFVFFAQHAEAVDPLRPERLTSKSQRSSLGMHHPPLVVAQEGHPAKIVVVLVALSDIGIPPTRISVSSRGGRDLRARPLRTATS